jgi:hypothetical protein
MLRRINWSVCVCVCVCVCQRFGGNWCLYAQGHNFKMQAVESTEKSSPCTRLHDVSHDITVILTLTVFRTSHLEIISIFSLKMLYSQRMIWSQLYKKFSVVVVFQDSSVQNFLLGYYHGLDQSVSLFCRKISTFSFNVILSHSYTSYIV